MGSANMLASRAPYMVVSSATAIPAPIWLGSSIFDSIFTRPISVPIMPNAGANRPTFSKSDLPIGVPFLDRVQLAFHDLLDEIRIGAVHRHLDAGDQEVVLDLANGVFQREDSVAAGDFRVVHHSAISSLGSRGLLMKMCLATLGKTQHADSAGS
jgi:hypothetical protein